MSDYAVAHDKCLIKPCSDLFTGWVKCGDVAELVSYGDAEFPDGVVEGLHWRQDRKIPASIMQKVLGTVHNYKNKETGYVLYRNGMTGEWDIKAPEQLGSPAHVNFFEEEHPNKVFQVVGTIHTHPEMSAFWSGTDLNDQTHKPGTLHMVFGLRDGHVEQTLCTVFLKSSRYDIPFSEIVEPVDFAEHYQADADWIRIIDRQSYRVPASSVAYLDDFTGLRVGGLGRFSKAPCKWSATGATGSLVDRTVVSNKVAACANNATVSMDGKTRRCLESMLDDTVSVLGNVAELLGEDIVTEAVLEELSSTCSYSWFNCPICGKDIESRPEQVLEDILDYTTLDEGKAHLKAVLDVLDRYQDELEAEAYLLSLDDSDDVSSDSGSCMSPVDLDMFDDMDSLGAKK